MYLWRPVESRSHPLQGRRTPLMGLASCDAQGRLALPFDMADRRYRKNASDAPRRNKSAVTAMIDGPRRVIASTDKAARALKLRPLPNLRVR
jgi:hypothetical protein